MQTSAVISTGTVELRDPDVDKAKIEVEKVVARHAGTVSDEISHTDERGDLVSSRLVIRVPSKDFDVVVDELEAISKIAESSKKSEDVTTEVIDVEARVRAQEAALRRIETLLRSAESMRDIIAIEAEITRRQADLDSLKGQQAWLQDQTSLSTITVFIERTEVPLKKKDEHSAFVAGLIDGWGALVALTTGLARGVGVLLPLLIPVLLVAVSLLWLLRRVARRIGRTWRAGPSAGQPPVDQPTG